MKYHYCSHDIKQFTLVSDQCTWVWNISIHLSLKSIKSIDFIMALQYYLVGTKALGLALYLLEGLGIKSQTLKFLHLLEQGQGNTPLRLTWFQTFIHTY